MIRAGLVLVCLAARIIAAQAVPTTFDLFNPPPTVVEDTTKAPNCTVTYLVIDIATSDVIAVRMRIAPAADDRPTNNVMPCPPNIPPRVAARALDACILRAADPKDCVYADMGRDFEQRPIANNTAENSSRCLSDKASDIGIACGRAGELQVCGVGCGDSPRAATEAAVARCEAKHQRQCPMTGSLPVLAPR